MKGMGLPVLYVVTYVAGVTVFFAWLFGFGG